MDDAAYAGAQNEPDDTGSGAPIVPDAGAGIPSVAATPVVPAPSLGAVASQALAPSDNADAIASLQQQLATLQHPVVNQPSSFSRALRVALPLLAAAMSAKSGMGAAGYAQGFQNADDIQAAKVKASSAQADQDAQAQFRITEAIHQLQAEDTANKRAQALADHQTETEAQKQAALARQKALDTYGFLNKQAENPNWVQSTLDLVNHDPTNLDKLSVQSPWGEAIPMSQIANLGFISQDPESGQYVVKSKKPPVTRFVHDNGDLYSVQLDPQSNQEISRTWISHDTEKAPKPDSTQIISLVPGQDPRYPNGGTFVIDKDTRVAKPVTIDGGQLTGAKVAPGAQKEAGLASSAAKASGDIQAALAQVAAAQKAGILGPANGRIIGQFLGGTVGSTNDPNLDRQLGGLRAAIKTINLSYPQAISGTTRSGGSVDRLGSVLNTDKFSADMLQGALTEMKAATDRRQPSPGSSKDNPQIVGPTYAKDATGKWVKQVKQ